MIGILFVGMFFLPTVVDNTVIVLDPIVVTAPAPVKVPRQGH